RATKSSSASPGRRPPDMAEEDFQDDNETRLEDLADRIRPRSASNLLLWAILGFVAIFLIWASIAELDRTVRGQGRVISSSQLQVLSNREGGIVEAILVRTGQQVQRDQELVRLSPVMTGAELGSGQAMLGALRAKIARLEAERSEEHTSELQSRE